MKQFIIGMLLVMMLSANIASASISTDGLSKENIAEMELYKAKMKVKSIKEDSNVIKPPKFQMY